MPYCHKCGAMKPSAEMRRTKVLSLREWRAYVCRTHGAEGRRVKMGRKIKKVKEMQNDDRKTVA